MTCHHFRYLDLSLGATGGVGSVAELPTTLLAGVHVFYCHSSLVQGIASREPDAALREFTAQLATGVSLHGVELSIDTDWGWQGEWLPRPHSLIPIHPHCCQDKAEYPAKVEEVFKKLREYLHTYPESPNPIFVLAHATAWDIVEDRTKLSPMSSGQLGHHYHEYLLWDGGGLWGEKGMPDDVTGRDVWFGAGWTAGRHCSLSSQSKKCVLPPELETHLTAAIRSLVDFDKLLATAPPVWLAGQKPTPESSFIRVLSEFSPPHWNPRRKEYIISSIGKLGGALLWKGILHKDLGRGTRLLLLDGWLTLWPSSDARDGSGNESGDLYLQPGSLAVLYWAAGQCGKPYTTTPEEFMENYQWAAYQKWFGGRWVRPLKGKNDKEGGGA